MSPSASHAPMMTARLALGRNVSEEDLESTIHPWLMGLLWAWAVLADRLACRDVEIVRVRRLLDPVAYLVHRPTGLYVTSLEGELLGGWRRALWIGSFRRSQARASRPDDLIDTLGWCPRLSSGWVLSRGAMRALFDRGGDPGRRAAAIIQGWGGGHPSTLGVSREEAEAYGCEPGRRTGRTTMALLGGLMTWVDMGFPGTVVILAGSMDNGLHLRGVFGQMCDSFCLRPPDQIEVVSVRGGLDRLRGFSPKVVIVDHYAAEVAERSGVNVGHMLAAMGVRRRTEEDLR